MKALHALIFLIGLLSQDAGAEDRELPIDRKLPKIGNEWSRRKDDGKKGDYSWVNFESKHQVGEVLSFVAWKVPPKAAVTDGFVMQASVETFWSDGNARFTGTKAGLPIKDMLRHQIVPIKIGTKEMKHEIDTIEYTYVYEGDRETTVRLAHGYCLVFGETALFVQHTSNNMIDSELAFEMAAGLLSRHFQLMGTPHSYSKGKVRKSNS